jgi:hypothetical protein
MPLPQEYDDYFVTRLAMRLNPRYGQAVPDVTVEAMNRIEQKIRARYRQPRPRQDIGTLGLMGSSANASTISTSAISSGRDFW